MNGSEWCAALQASGEASIQAAVLEAIGDGHALAVDWIAVPVQHNGHSGAVYVSREPLRIGTPTDYVYPMVTAKIAQTISEKLGCLQPTTRILDLAYETAPLRVQPVPTQPADTSSRVARGYSPSMKDALAMLRFSKDCQKAAHGFPGVYAMPFKVWVLTNALAISPPTQAFNYGFFDQSAPYLSASGQRMWQPMGSKHDTEHFDYSQVFVAVRDTMLVDGKPMLVVDVGNDPELCWLISSEGVVKTWNQACTRHKDPSLPPHDPSSEALLEFHRALKLTSPHMHGSDVVEWQRHLTLVADGDFGPQTDAATRQFQRSHGLTPDGVVGPVTIAAANTALDHVADTNTIFSIDLSDSVEDLVSQFAQAKHYTPTSRGQSDIRYIVLHTAEMAELPTNAEALMHWAAGPSAPMASWHYAVDNDSITQSVKDECVAWHAPGANDHGIGIEMVGYAKQSAEEWSDPFSVAMLDRCAVLVAALATKWGLPIQFVNAAELREGKKLGITTHAAVTEAFRQSTHTDPGPNFPMQFFLEAVRGRVAGSSQ